MRRMSDLGEITALVNSYALLLDGGDMDAVAALFAHSTWRSEPEGHVLRGVEEIRPVYEQLKSPEGGPRTKHLLTNLTVDVEPGASTASAHCYWTVLQNIGPGRPDHHHPLGAVHRHVQEGRRTHGASPTGSSRSTSPGTRQHTSTRSIELQVLPQRYSAGGPSRITVLVSRNGSRPSVPPSRPIPDCLKPPKAIPKSVWNAL